MTALRPTARHCRWFSCLPIVAGLAIATLGCSSDDTVDANGPSGGSGGDSGMGGQTDAAAGGHVDGSSIGDSHTPDVSPDHVANTEQTLVFVRHAQTQANACDAVCDDGLCCEAFTCVSGCDECSCSANLTNFSTTGWGQIGDVLIGKLNALGLDFDTVVSSPAWRCQETIKAYMVAANLHGTIAPELDETWLDTGGSGPVWSTDQYSINDGLQDRLAPRPYNAGWDTSADSAKYLYDHDASGSNGEAVMHQRGLEYIESVFAAGADNVVVATHGNSGGAILALLGYDDYYLLNAASITILKRNKGSSIWIGVGNNL